MNGMPLVLLIYSTFTINIVLQCALGIKGIVDSKNHFNLSSMIKVSLIFLSVIISWFFFSRIIFSVISVFLMYILMFPVSSMIYTGFEYIVFAFLLKKGAKYESVIDFPGVITAVAVFVCINISHNIFETVVLSFGFVFGIFLVNILVYEIRKRASLEAVPAFLRGKPLVLVTMGLLSLVFTTASILLFRMIGEL
ncbi:MAG: hypothetical protein FWC06_05410 [Treponema sp.]|nr:hypothetical protein [Treponema sp.]